MQPNSAVIVLGMHRSGTSVLCKAVESLGVNFGSHLLQGDQWNAKGYFEHYAIQQLDDRLLRLLGVRWSTLDLSVWEDALPWTFALQAQAVDLLRRDFAEEPLWGLKDPRMCRLLPFWKNVFQELGAKPSYVLALRNPLNVAISLNKRDGLTIRHGALLWMSHMATAFVDSADALCAAVEYECLLSNPSDELERLSAILDLPIPQDMCAAREEFVSTFLDRDLQHNQQSIGALNAHPDVPMQVKELYAAMFAMASRQPSDEDWKRIRSQCSDLMTRWWPQQVASLQTPDPDIMAFRESAAMIGRLRSELVGSDAELIAAQSQVASQATLIGGKDAEIMRLRGDLVSADAELIAAQSQVASQATLIGDKDAEIMRLRGELEAHQVAASAKDQDLVLLTHETRQLVETLRRVESEKELKELELRSLEQENHKLRDELSSRVAIIEKYEWLLKIAGARLN